MSKVYPLKDNQRLAVQPERTVWLSASAGTGKTQVLSARVLRLLLQPDVSPDQILCLTFTKAGAAEMATRVNDVLASWVRLPEIELARELDFIGAPFGPETVSRARSLFAAVLDCPGGGLRVETIHAFSQWLLGAFPVEAGLIPGTRAMEDRDRDLLLREVLADLLVTAERDCDDPMFAALEDLSLRMGEDAVPAFLLRCAGAHALWHGPGAWQPPLRPRINRVLGLDAEEDGSGLAEMLRDEVFDVRSVRRCMDANLRWGRQTGLDAASIMQDWLESPPAARMAGLDGFASQFLKADGEPRSPRYQLKVEPDYAEYQARVIEYLKQVSERRALIDLAARLDPADAFSRLRGRQLVEAARDFDELASRDVVEFLQYAERYKVRDADTAAVVRVLTIHKAKGLGFDLVILPDLEGGFGARRASLAVRKAPDRSVSWILEVPNKVFADSDPVLTQYKEEADAQAAYEALCKLYVAMTRAKRAMYLVTQPVAEGSRTRDFPRLLRDTLGEAYREGDARWYEALRPEPPAISGDCVVKVEAPPAPARLPARTPSGTERSVLQGAQVFALSASAGAERGTAVHALLAEIGWRRPGDGGVGSELWIHADAAIRAEAQACLDAPALEEVFARPSEALGESELWRERAFEVVLDGHWITGICDRVVISRESGGAARCAWVWDFKTDRVGDRAGALRAAGRYAEQLGLYRRVVARLTGLAEKEVRCGLVFTQIREWVPMG